MFSSATKEAANETKNLAEHDVRRRLNENGETMMDKAKNTAHEAMDDAADYAETAGRNARKAVNNAGKEIEATAKTISQEIQDNPIKAALITAFAGFLMGVMVRR